MCISLDLIPLAILLSDLTETEGDRSYNNKQDNNKLQKQEVEEEHDGQGQEINQV